MDIEVTLQFHVHPVVHGVAKGVGNGFRKCLELVPWAGVPGDALFVDAVCAEEAPLVVVVAEPEVGNVFPSVIGGDLFGWKVVVVVDNGLVCRDLVVKAACGFRIEEEIFVKICHVRSDLTPVSALGKARTCFNMQPRLSGDRFRVAY